MKRLFLLIILLGFTNIVLAIEVDAGEDKTGCPGEEIEIGGNPTASPESGSYQYTWSSSNGSFSSSEANPTITVTDKVTQYTVVVEDQDGFMCEASMTVTPVKIENISFSQKSLPADGSSTATASANTSPSGRTIRWSIEGDAIGCTIDETTGLITAGDEVGEITIRASDKESFDNGVECNEEELYCIGKDCCEDVETSRSFGPITVSFPDKIKSKGEDAQGWCEYEVAEAGINLEMYGTFSTSYSYNLNGINVSWKEKDSQFKEVKINWTGSVGEVSTREFGVIQANITAIELTVSSAGAVSGTVTFTVNQTNEVSVGGIAVLNKGTQGTFTYTYSSSSSFEGAFDFGGITGIKIDLKKGSTKIATLTGSMDTDGNLDANFKANTPGTFSTASGFSATLTQLNLNVIWNITDNELDFKTGTGKVKIKDINNLKGEVLLELTFNNANVVAASTLSDVTAFGCTVSGTVETDFNMEFELNSITGSNISAKHDKFDRSFENVGFEVKDGSMEKFSIGEITVKYDNKILFTMTKADYNKSQSSLVFDARVVIGGLSADVTRFAIDPEGSVTVGNVKLEVDQSPVNLSANFAYKENEFKGDYTGEFKGGINMEGAVVIGAEADFNYAYFALALGGSTGVPLGGSGLMVNKLGGEFGYNWLPGDDFASISGSPQNGTNVIGFLLGIGDVANLTAIEGSIKLTLGSADAIDLDGSVKVTATSPHYLQGDVSIHYVLGSYDINGSLSSTVQFPPGTGEIVFLNTGDINFGIADNNWNVSATGMNGKIFDAIVVTANLDMGSPLSNLGAMSGSLSGTLDFTNSYSYVYPDGFDPASCETADNTDDLVGFGIEGQIEIILSGALSAALNSEGIVGAISAKADANGVLSVKWPCLVICGNDCVDAFDGGAAGNLNVEYNGDITRVYGQLTFTSGDEQETGEIDFEL